MYKLLDEFCLKFPVHILNKYLIYTKDFQRGNGVEYIPVYMTMFLLPVINVKRYKILDNETI